MSTPTDNPPPNGNGNGNKVAIPRHPRSGIQPRYTRRVARACTSCRARKTKCSGDTPTCRQCRELRIACSYPDTYRERTRREIEGLVRRGEEFEGLLREISAGESNDVGDGGVGGGTTPAGTAAVDGGMKERIREVLERHAHVKTGTESPGSGTGEKGKEKEKEKEKEKSTSATATPDDVAEQDAADDDGASSPSSIGSLDAIDRVDEDLNRSPETRATGYMGKNSEITWMQRLRREAEQRAHAQSGTYEPVYDRAQDSEFALHALNYHLDDIDISVAGPVHVYWVPPRELADRLFDDYLATVHPFFPIISRPLFRAQYRTFYENVAARPGDKWLAILNMIFAIAAKHAHLMQAPWRGGERDHLEYLTRARILSMNGDTLFSHPDLQQVQVEGLISFYLLSSDQINRYVHSQSGTYRQANFVGHGDSQL